MENLNNELDLYPEALKLFKAKITDINKIKERLYLQYPNEKEAVKDAITKLRTHRRNMGIRSLIIGIIILPLGILFAYFFLDRGGLIEMALIGALIGGSFGLILKGGNEFFKMR